MTPAYFVRAWDLLADAALQSCLLCLAAGVGLLLLRRSAAASRHLLLLLLMCLLPLLPLLSSVLPHVSWGGALSRISETPVRPDTVSAPAFPAPSGPTLADKQISTTLPAQNALTSARPVSPGLSLRTDTPSPAQSAASYRPQSPSRARVLLSREVLKQGVLALWLLGCGGMLLRIPAGLLAMRARRRRSEPIQQERVLQLAAEARREMGLRGEIALRQTQEGDSSGIPVTWGFLRPTLLLPVYLLSWSPERLKMILLHEMAHIRRRDWLAQILAQITCALYWFNPLVWWAEYRLREECERACDDCVLLAGVAPSNYADTLLEVIKTMKESRSFRMSALSMARLPVENRLRAILTSLPLHRRKLQRPVLALLLLGAIACGLSFAALHVSATPKVQHAQPLKEGASAVHSTAPAVLSPLSQNQQYRDILVAQKATPSKDDEVAELRKKLDAQEQQLARSKQENEDLRKKLDNLRAQQKTTNQKKKAASDKLLSNQRASIEAVIISRQRELDLQSELLKSAEAQYRAGQATLEAVLNAQIKQDSARQQLQLLQQQLSTLKAGRPLTIKEWERGKLETELAVLQLEIKHREELLDIARKRYQVGIATKSELDAAEAEIARCKARIGELKLLLSQQDSN